MPFALFFIFSISIVCLLFDDFFSSFWLLLHRSCPVHCQIITVKRKIKNKTVLDTLAETNQSIQGSMNLFVFILCCGNIFGCAYNAIGNKKLVAVSGKLVMRIEFNETFYCDWNGCVSMGIGQFAL